MKTSGHPRDMTCGPGFTLTNVASKGATRAGGAPGTVLPENLYDSVSESSGLSRGVPLAGNSGRLKGGQRGEGKREGGRGEEGWKRGRLTDLSIVIVELVPTQRPCRALAISVRAYTLPQARRRLSAGSGGASPGV